jgi:hypothetical protein
MASVTTDVSDQRVASIFSVERISELGTLSVANMLVTAKVAPGLPILSTLKLSATRSSKTSVLAKPTRRHILEDGIPNPFYMSSR